MDFEFDENVACCCAVKISFFFLSVYLFFSVKCMTPPLFVYIELVVRRGYFNNKKKHYKTREKKRNEVEKKM